MKRTTKAQVLVATGAILGVSLILYGAWQMSAKDRPKTAATAPAAAAAQVVIAAKPIARGQKIIAADLGLMPVQGAAPDGSIRSMTDVAGKTATVDIAQNQVVLTSSLAGQEAAAGLAPLVPVGMRAISMDVTTEIAVANFVRPGDKVDLEIVLPKGVIAPSGQGPDASEARSLLQNLSVLAVGEKTTAGADEESKKPDEQAAARENRTITVAMTPEQVSQFVLARSLGRFYLTLRNPADQDAAPGGRAQLASLRGGAVSRPGPAAAGSGVRRVRARPSAPIEMVVEGRREVLYPGAGG